MTSVAELFERMPEAFDAAKAGDMEATVQFDLGGDNGGQWYVEISGGQVNVEKGATESATATIRMAADDYKAMIAGDLNPVTAFMTQKIKVEGDLNTVMKFQTLFNT